MSFQGTINQGIGAIGAVAGVKKVVEGQQAGNELTEKNNELAEKTNELAKDQVAATEKQTEAINAQTETISKAQEQWNKINEPDYGQTMLNAEAEAKSIASLLNSQYPGYKLENVRNSYNNQAKSDIQKLEEAHQTALEKWKTAAMEYNYPNGKQMSRTLTGGND